MFMCVSAAMTVPVLSENIDLFLSEWMLHLEIQNSVPMSSLFNKQSKKLLSNLVELDIKIKLNNPFSLT